MVEGKAATLRLESKLNSGPEEARFCRVRPIALSQIAISRSWRYVALSGPFKVQHAITPPQCTTGDMGAVAALHVNRKFLQLDTSNALNYLLQHPWMTMRPCIDS